MKRILKIFLVSTGILLLLCVATGWVITSFYGKEIKNYFVSELNKHLTAKVNVKDIDFSVFSNFPLASIEFKEVIISSQAPFEVPLANIKQLNLAFSLLDIYHKNYNVKKIYIKGGEFNILQKGDLNNYFFWKKDSTTTGNISFKLRKIQLTDCRFYYNDGENTSTHLQTEDFTLKGIFSDGNYTLDCEGSYHLTDLITKGLILKDKSGKIQTELTSEKDIFKIENGKLSIAEVALEINGVFSPDQFNVHFNADHLSVKETLPLIYPNATIKDFDPEGTISLNGSVIKKESIQIQAAFTLKDGAINSSKYGLNIKNIQFIGNVISNNSGLAFSLKHYSGEMNNSPFQGSLSINESKINTYDFTYKGGLDIPQVISLCKLNYKAEGTADLTLASSGTFDSIAFHPSNLTAELLLKNALLEVNEKQTIKGINGAISFSDKNILFKDLTSNINNSDLSITGEISQPIFDVIKNKQINFSGTVYSNHLNTEDFLVETKKDTGKPFSIDAEITAKIGELKCQGVSLTSTTAKISKDGDLIQIQSFSTDVFNGKITGSVSIMPLNKDSLIVSCDGSLKKLNIQSLFKGLDNFGQTTLTDKHLNGLVDADVKLVFPASRDFNFKKKDLYAKCKVSIDNGELNNFTPLRSLSKFIDINELQSVKFSNLKNELEVKDGKIFIPEMEIRSSALNLSAHGTHDFDNMVEYHLKLLLSDLLGKKAKSRMTEFGEVEDDGGGKTYLFITMKGDMKDPQFAYDRKSVQKKIGADLATEGRTIRELLKAEFSVKKKAEEAGKKLAEKKEQTDEIDWEKAPVKKEVKPAEVTAKKSFGQRLKERLKEKEEIPQ